MSDSARHRSSTIKQAPPPLVLPGPRHKFVPFSARPASPTPTPTHPTAPTQPSTTRFRAHLAHLLPRHAAFTVSVTLHQLHNVPLVHGEFGLKWRIKGVTSHSGIGILDKVKARKAKSHPSGSGDPTTTTTSSSLARSSDTDNAPLFDAASMSDTHSVANSSSTHPPSPYSADGHTTRTQPVPIPAVIVSANHSSPSPVARSASIASVSSMSSISSMSPRLRGPSAHNPPGYLSAEWARQASAPSMHTESPLDAAPDLKSPAKPYYSPAKGITPFIKLQDHNVVWEQTLKLVVQMSVARDNGELGDCLAKFVVMQRVVAGDPDAPRNPRLGAVHLNLAQYVDAGVVTRRYLLRQSKTNATLKLTIHVQHTAGDTAYVAPPLPKGEILSGVAAFLESSDIYRTRPRASDLYTHTSSDSSSDDGRHDDHDNHDRVGPASGSDASSVVSGSGGSHEPRRRPSHLTTSKPHRRPLDVAKLPTISDPRGTEKLIEALFNPVPVTDAGKVTPFTYLVEVNGEGDGDGDGDGDRDRYVDGNGERERGGLYGDQHHHNGDDDDGSLYADSQGESTCDGEGAEYHSLRSRPSFPSSLRSKRSVRSLASKVGLGLGRVDDGGEETAAASSSMGVLLDPRATTEKRTWWQKVLSLPSIE